MMNSNTKLLSILVPVYNVERFVEGCFDSILKSASELLDDIEIIVVNDGSTDNSGEICDNYAKRYPTIFRVVHKENEGTGATRNLLLLLVQAQYLWFVDSDDTITEDAIPRIVKELSSPQQCDILSFCLQRYYSNGEFSPAEGVPTKKGIMPGEEYLLSNQFNGFMCNKVYRTDFIRKNNIVFNPNLISQEDTLFNFNALVHCNLINITDYTLYNYYQGNPNSTLTNKSREASERKIHDSIVVEVELAHIIKNEKRKRIALALQKILNYHISGFLHALMITSTPTSRVNEVIEELRKKSLYPVGESISAKGNLFLKFANRKFIFLFLCSLYKLMKHHISKKQI